MDTKKNVVGDLEGRESKDCNNAGTRCNLTPKKACHFSSNTGMKNKDGRNIKVVKLLSCSD